MNDAHRALPRCSSLMTMTLCMRSIQILMEFSQLSQLRGQTLPKRVVRDMSDLPPIATEERSSRDVSNLPHERTFTYQ
jgi:hypothetical protein